MNCCRLLGAAMLCVVNVACARSNATTENRAAPESPSSGTSAPSHPVAVSPSVLEPGAVRLPRETISPRTSAGAATPATAAGGISAGATSQGTGGGATPIAVEAPTPFVVRVVVRRVSVAEGEDGRGNTVRATNPVAIDLEREGGWPGGALTTTLQIGALHFHNMGYPEITTMRFIAADANALPTNADVAVQYGTHPDLRRVVAHGLTVPR